jgi:hypothetical protein
VWSVSGAPWGGAGGCQSVPSVSKLVLTDPLNTWTLMQVGPLDLAREAEVDKAHGQGEQCVPTMGHGT